MLFLSSSVVCSAEQLTMDVAINAALSANPDISAAGYAADAAGARAPQAATPPDPMFMLDVYQVPIDTIDIKDGMIEYMVEQQIPFPSKLVFGYKAEKRAAEAALKGKTAAEQEVVREVKRAYLELWRLQEEARIEHETLAIYRQNKGSSEEAYATLKGSVADPVRASVELGEVEAKLAGIDEERLDAIANLSKLMATNIDSSINVANPPPLPHIRNLDELIEDAKSTRPEIEEAASLVKSQSARLSLAKSQFGPDILLRWGFMDMPGNQQNAWRARLGLSVPLWSFSKQRFGVRESKAELARAKSMKEAAVLSTESDVKSAHAKFMAAKRVMDIYTGTVVPRAKMLLSSTKESYKSGRGDFLNVVDSIRSLNNAEIMLVRAKTDAAKAAADLERAVGTPLVNGT